jgi:hypothetical protein
LLLGLRMSPSLKELSVLPRNRRQERVGHVS